MFRFLFRVLALCSVTSLTAVATAAEDVVELPKFEVTDSQLLPPQEQWRYAEIPGFEILSSLSERETRRFVKDFHLLQQVMLFLWPPVSRGSSAVPTTLILCGRSRDFQSFVPADRVLDTHFTNSLFFRRNDRTSIVVDFALSEFVDAQGQVIEVDSYRSFYLEYVRALIRQSTVEPPPHWLEEGLVQLFASIDFSKKHVTIGQVGTRFGAGKPGDFNRIIEGRAGSGPVVDSGDDSAANSTSFAGPRALMDLNILFGPERPPVDDTSLYEAQCYAFVHFCFYGWWNKRFQPCLIDFVERASVEPVTEEMFKDCFGLSYKQMMRELRMHTQATASRAVEFRAKKGSDGFDDPPPIDLRSATDAEVGRIKGETYQLAGHAELARTNLIAPYIRGERDPSLLAALGLHERAEGRDARARKFLEAAAQAKTTRAITYLELARLRYAEAAATPKGADSKLSRQQLLFVLEPLQTARKLPPPMVATYELIDQVWAASDATPTREDLAALTEGAFRHPRSLKLAYLAASRLVQHGFAADATPFVKHGLKYARTYDARSKFAALESALPPPTPAAATPPQP